SPKATASGRHITSYRSLPGAGVIRRRVRAERQSPTASRTSAKPRAPCPCCPTCRRAPRTAVTPAIIRQASQDRRNLWTILVKDVYPRGWRVRSIVRAGGLAMRKGFLGLWMLVLSPPAFARTDPDDPPPPPRPMTIAPAAAQEATLSPAGPAAEQERSLPPAAPDADQKPA